MDPVPLYVENEHPTLSVDEAALERLALHIVEAEHRTLISLGIILSDHDTVLELNRTYLQHNYYTDVISFDLREAEDEPVVEGEVYVDLDTAAERHAEFDTSFEEEVQRYVVHGLLHLIGYKDTTPEEKDHMHALENRYLSALRDAS